MADDKTQQKIKNVQAQEAKGRQDVKTRIQNAQRFSQLLALGELTPEEKLALQYAQNFEEFSRVLGQRHIEDQHEFWEAREDWWAYRNIPSPQEPPPSTQQARAGGLPGASTGAGLAVGAGLGLASKLRPEKYEDFKNRADSYAQNAAKLWEEEEKKNQKDPSKKIDLNRPLSKQKAYDKANSSYHDILVRRNQKLAGKWAQEHNDLDLIGAIDRKRVADAQVKNQSLVRRTYRTIRRQPAPVVPVASTTWTPSPQNVLPGTLPPNTLGGVGAPNALRGAQPPVQAPRSPGVKGRAKSFGSNLGKRSRKTASSAISYLTRLIRGSGIAGAILGFASGALTALGTAIVTAVTAVLGALSLIVAPVIALAAKIIALGVVIAFIGLLLAAILVAICKIPGVTLLPGMSGACEGIQDPEDLGIPELPEGVTISKEGPSRIENGEDIEYTIGVTYEPNTATLPLSELKVIDWPQFNHQFISASGNYRMEGDFITWVLSENTHTGTDVYLFTFTLRLRPLDQDIEAINIYFVHSPQSEQDGGIDPNGPIDEGIDHEPTNNDCGGKYASSMTAIKADFGVTEANFGDPVCSFTKNKLRQVIERAESNPINVEFWMDIADCESTANGYGRGTERDPDTGLYKGTWGHFQMDRSYPNPLKPWDPDNNNRGDITWQRQVENAVDYNVNTLAPLNQRFEYWETAKALCGWPKYSSRPYCSDIVANGKAIPAGTSSNDCANALGQE